MKTSVRRGAHPTSVKSVCVLLCATALIGQATEVKATFPMLKASNLAKKEMTLPRDFAGQWNLVLIAFLREQQKDVDTWLKALPGIQKDHSGLAYYELPTIKKMSGMTRWFIDTGMRGGIPDQQQRARTITLYIDKEPFRRALTLPAEDRIYALLLNKAGEVVWRAEGLYDDAKGSSLREFLKGR